MLIARGMFGPVELGGNRAINGNPCMLDPSCTAMDGMIHKTVKLMAGMRDLTRNGHSKLLVVLIPWELQLPRRILALSRINFYATDAHRHTMTAKVERELEKVGIPTLDLLPAFEAYTGTEPLVWPEDRHWTAAGHRLTAEALAPALIGMTGATPSAEKE